MEQLVPGRRRVGGAGGQQLPGDLGEGGLNVPRIHVKGGPADDESPAAEVLRGKAELLQQGEPGGQRGVLLRGQAAHRRGQERLGHGIVALRLHAVEVHPLVGGVLVDEQHFVPLLHDDVGVQHLACQPPGLLLGEQALRSRLPGHLRRFFRLFRGGTGRLRPVFDRICRHLADVFHIVHRLIHIIHIFFHRAEGRSCLLLASSFPVHRGCGGCPLRRDRGGADRLGGQRLGTEERIASDRPLRDWAGRVMDRQQEGGRLCPGGLRCRSRGARGCRGRPGGLRHRRGPGAVSLQGGAHRVVHGAEHRPLAAELHLRLGGVDIHIHRAQLHPQVEHTGGEAAHHLLVLVGLLQGGQHQPGLHLPAVDKEELPVPAGPAAGGLGHKAGDRHLLPRALHPGEAQGQLPAQNGVYGALQLSVPGGEQFLLSVPEKFHAHLRVGQGDPLDHREHGGTLGGVLLHKLQPGGGVVKQVPHHHRGP